MRLVTGEAGFIGSDVAAVANASAGRGGMA